MRQPPPAAKELTCQPVVERTIQQAVSLREDRALEEKQQIPRETTPHQAVLSAFRQQDTGGQASPH